MGSDIVVSPVSADSDVAVCMDTGIVQYQCLAALFVWTLVLYNTSVCDSPVCKDTGIVQYQYGHRDVIVHPMFVWTGTLLLTLCLCGQGYCC